MGVLTVTGVLMGAKHNPKFVITFLIISNNHPFALFDLNKTLASGNELESRSCPYIPTLMRPRMNFHLKSLFSFFFEGGVGGAFLPPDFFDRLHVRKVQACQRTPCSHRLAENNSFFFAHQLVLFLL